MLISAAHRLNADGQTSARHLMLPPFDLGLQGNRSTWSPRPEALSSIAKLREVWTAQGSGGNRHVPTSTKQISDAKLLVSVGTIPDDLSTYFSIFRSKNPRR